MDSCIFCKILRGEIPSAKVWEDDEFYAFRDIHPAAPVHVLVIPKTHVANIAACAPQHEAMLGRLLLAVPKIAKQEGLDAFRLIFNNGEGAGQTVFHLHAHILGGATLGEKLV